MPYHRFEEFWDGFADYQHDCNRRCPHEENSVAGQAWDRGTEAAMRLHWDAIAACTPATTWTPERCTMGCSQRLRR
jgi:hypothetical protein